MSSLPMFIGIFIMLAGLYYFNDNGGRYNQDGILKLVKMACISAFFSIIGSISTIYFDKMKIKKSIHNFKREFNRVNATDDVSFIENMSDEIWRDISEGIKKRKPHYEKVKDLEIQTFNFKVKGINVKKVECRVSCIMLFSLEQSKNIIFNFHSINNGGLKLQNIVFSMDPESSGVLIDSPKG